MCKSSKEVPLVSAPDLRFEGRNDQLPNIGSGGVTVSGETQNGVLVTICGSDLLTNRGKQDDFEGVPSPAVSTSIKTKYSRYRLLTHIAKIQHLAGKRQDRVLFLACVMSHTGEMAKWHRTFSS